MIRKWVSLNVLITIIIIVLVGFSIKEFACYQFSHYAQSPIQAEQFRDTLEHYFLLASLFAFALALFIHLIFARKILQPLRKLTVAHEISDLQSVKVNSNDEIGQIANDLLNISEQVHSIHEERDEMMANLAHELRTPLTTLNGYVEGLEDGLFSGDEDAIAILKKECKQLIAIIERMNELHQWESEEEIKYETVSIATIVTSVFRNYANEFATDGFTVTVDVESSEIPINGRAISLILRELLTNVLQYDVGKTIELSGRDEKENYIISVSNKGTSIPKEIGPQLFERFYRVDASRTRSTGGSGLGLAIAKQIVTKLDGEIDFNSSDQWHTFWFSIPKRAECNRK